MNIYEFSQIKNVNLLYQFANLDKLAIENISFVSCNGDLFWIKEKDFVFIMSDFITNDDLNSIIKNLICKKINGICIISHLNIVESNINLCKNEKLPLFTIDNFDKAYFVLNNVFTHCLNSLNVSKYLFSQFKNSVIALMSSPNFIVLNLVHLLSIYLHRDVYLFSFDYNLMCTSNPNNKISTSSVTDILNSAKTAKSFSTNIIECTINYEKFICYTLKSETIILGYLIIDNSFNNWSDLSDIDIKEIIPYFVISIINNSKSKVLKKKSMEDFLQNCIYGFISDESELKLEASNFNLEYYKDRFIWILNIENLKNKSNFNCNAKIVSYALNFCKTYFCKNLFLENNNRIISVQEKDAISDDTLMSKFSEIVTHLNDKFNEFNFCIGFSRSYPSVHDFKHAYDDAAFSISMGKKIFASNQNLFNYNSLLIYHLLYNQLDNPIIQRLYYNTIYKIKLFDTNKNDVLLETLKSLIDNNFNYTQTAKILFIHRNTLYQRINKIECIVDMSFEDSQTMLLLQLGMVFHNILSTIN